MKKFNFTKTFGIKYGAIAIICLWSSYLFAQGPVKYPSTNGSKMSANEIMELGGALQVNVLLIPDTSWKGHGKPPKYYMIFADDQGRFFRGPERRLTGGKPAGVGGGGPPICNSLTNAWVDDPANATVYLCTDDFQRLGLGTSTPGKILHIVGLHQFGGPVPFPPPKEFSHSGIRIEDQIEDLNTGIITTSSWDLEPIGLSRFHIGPTDDPIDEPAMILTKDGNTGLGFISPRYRLHLHRKGAKDVYSYYTNSHTSAILISPKKGEGVQMGMSEFGHAEIRNNHAGGTIRFWTKDAVTNTISEKMTILDDGRVIIGQRQKTGAFNDALLQVDGDIITSGDVLVTTTGWSDYVLAPGYPLPDLLSKVKPDILIDNSLDGIPTTEEVVSKGIHLGEISKALVKKVEEIFLYLIKMKEEINAMMSDIFTLKNNDVKIQEEINELKEKNEMLKKDNVEMKNEIKEIKEMLIDLNKKNK